MEENHSEEWEQHLDYLQKEANGRKGQSVISFKLQFQLFTDVFPSNITIGSKIERKTCK